MLKRNIKGLSLLELFLAAIVFVTCTAAIFVSITSLRKPAVNADQSYAAALVLKNLLEDLRSKISASDMTSGGVYSTGSLTDGTHGPISSGGFTLYYTVTTNYSTGVRRVDANATWTDAM